MNNNLVKWYFDYAVQNKNGIASMYRIAKIPKKNGKVRTLEIPNRLLDLCQRDILSDLNIENNCSFYAAAYQKRKGIKNVVHCHTNKKLLLKLDIKNFFGSITADLIKERVFTSDIGFMLAELCCCNGHLPQGACTSPVISNLVMKDFDNALGSLCQKHNIQYSRYSDDMIFSGDFNPGWIIREVKTMLSRMNMELNYEKNVIAGRGKRQLVLGVVVNEKAQLPSEYRRKIRQEVYYCNKFGVRDHILKNNIEKYITKSEDGKEILSVNTNGYLRCLMGKISYAININPNDEKMMAYFNTVQKLQKEYGQ